MTQAGVLSHILFNLYLTKLPNDDRKRNRILYSIMPPMSLFTSRTREVNLELDISNESDVIQNTGSPLAISTRRGIQVRTLILLLLWNISGVGLAGQLISAVYCAGLYHTPGRLFAHLRQFELIPLHHPKHNCAKKTGFSRQPMDFSCNGRG